MGRRGSGGMTLVRSPVLTPLLSLSLSAPAEARERGQPGVLLLLLRRVRLLHQGQAQPGAARALREASADRGPAQAPAPPAGPGPRG